MVGKKWLSNSNRTKLSTFARTPIVVVLLILGVESASANELMLFGGKEGDEFIGCLNCNKLDKRSICNKYEDYGSKYSELSIWNKDGKYGSKYSEMSPWNKYAKTPPAVRDKNNLFQGFFAVSKYQKERISIRKYVRLLDNGGNFSSNLEKGREAFCQ